MLANWKTRIHLIWTVLLFIGVFFSIPQVTYAQGTTFVLEAEQMISANGYVQGDSEPISADTYIYDMGGSMVEGQEKDRRVVKLPGESNVSRNNTPDYYGYLQAHFTAPSGNYDVYFHYIDEHDDTWEYIEKYSDDADKRSNHPDVFARYEEAKASGIQLRGGSGSFGIGMGQNESHFFSNRIATNGSKKAIEQQICRGITINQGEAISIRANRSDNWLELGRIDAIVFVPTLSTENNCLKENDTSSVLTQDQTIKVRVYGGTTDDYSTRGDDPMPIPGGGGSGAGVNVTGLTFHPETTKIAGLESDTWPTTWTGDVLFTSFADGNGFENNRAADKLSMGYAVVEGGPTNFVGTNISSPDVQYGGGRQGKKASGLLAIDGNLFMNVRNADNNGNGCQLARSINGGVNWQFGPVIPQLGYCSFINFGKDYSGLPSAQEFQHWEFGAYVYMVSPDGPSAYDPVDGFIIARFPKYNLFEWTVTPGDLEYFSGDMNNPKSPTWTKDFNQRKRIYNNPGKSLRHGISYNPHLQKFFWWQGNRSDGPDGRFEGDFQVLVSDYPWGGWKVIHQAHWGSDGDDSCSDGPCDLNNIGPGETGHFPVKWMSGNEMWLVFSGDDTFAVRKATIQYTGTPGGGGQPPPTPAPPPPFACKVAKVDLPTITQGETRRVISKATQAVSSFEYYVYNLDNKDANGIPQPYCIQGFKTGPRAQNCPSGTGQLYFKGSTGVGGPMQTQNDHRIGTQSGDEILEQSYWKGNYGFFRTVPITNGTAVFNQAGPWSDPISLDQLTVGNGKLQAQAGVIVPGTGNYLQTIWRGNEAFYRLIPVQGSQVKWGEAGKWNKYATRANLPGTDGEVQAENLFISNNTGAVIQDVVINNIRYNREVQSAQFPSIKVNDWVFANVKITDFLPGNGDIQTFTAYRVGTQSVAGYWRNNQGWAATSWQETPFAQNVNYTGPIEASALFDGTVGSAEIPYELLTKPDKHPKANNKVPTKLQINAAFVSTSNQVVQNQVACVAYLDKTSSASSGDLNSDGKIDIFDYNLLVNNYGKTDCNLNLVNECLIDIFDYNQFVSVYPK